MYDGVSDGCAERAERKEIIYIETGVLALPFLVFWDVVVLALEIGRGLYTIEKSEPLCRIFMEKSLVLRVNCIYVKKLTVHIQGLTIIVYRGVDFFHIYIISPETGAKA